MTTGRPLVSVLTPVYNGGRYIAECIESVLNQSWQDWEYVIVDNCSSDDTPRIVDQYARKDSRIRALHNTSVLSIADNWNYTIAQLGRKSRYCKIVHADDWLFEDCLEKMVLLAERNASAGIVSSYIQEGDYVGGDGGVPFGTPVMSGKTVCRRTLMGQIPYLFGSPSALLLRSDLVRSQHPLYNERYQQLLDHTACYALLKISDFGFVHQVLTFHRMHDDSQTTRNQALNKLLPEHIQFLKEYGPHFLTEEDLKKRIQVRLKQYYRFLAQARLSQKDEQFWSFHHEKLISLGYPLDRKRLKSAVWKETLINFKAKFTHKARDIVYDF